MFTKFKSSAIDGSRWLALAYWVGSLCYNTLGLPIWFANLIVNFCQAIRATRRGFRIYLPTNEE